MTGDYPNRINGIVYSATGLVTTPAIAGTANLMIAEGPRGSLAACRATRVIKQNRVYHIANLIPCRGAASF
jgi:hypothetical protein